MELRFCFAFTGVCNIPPSTGQLSNWHDPCESSCSFIGLQIICSNFKGFCPCEAHRFPLPSFVVEGNRHVGLYLFILGTLSRRLRSRDSRSTKLDCMGWMLATYAFNTTYSSPAIDVGLKWGLPPPGTVKYKIDVCTDFGYSILCKYGCRTYG